jgi:hypothetical protein
MAKKLFRMTESYDGKALMIEGPADIEVEVDFDDVNHRRVKRFAKDLLAVLNEQFVVDGNYVKRKSTEA